MGNLASVLQWNCQNCKTINPTESLNCIKCGNVRKILFASSQNHHEHNTSNSKFYTDGLVAANSTDPKDSTSGKHSSSTNNSNSSTNLQSYVEITSGAGWVKEQFPNITIKSKLHSRRLTGCGGILLISPKSNGCLVEQSFVLFLSFLSDMKEIEHKCGGIHAKSIETSGFPFEIQWDSEFHVN